MENSHLPIRRVTADRSSPIDPGRWPATLAPVRQVLDGELELGEMTIFVGENGAGKSTLVEGIAMAYGLNPEGGSTGAMHRTRETESVLGDHLWLVRGFRASRRGFFLRAETMHGFYSYLEEIGGDLPFHERSHGESFLELVESRQRVNGLWILDEPESALSLSGCLALLAQLRILVGEGSQVILSTHSPALAAFPGADIYEVGDWGLRRCAYDDLDLVRQWRAFLDGPERFLRHVF